MAHRILIVLTSHDQLGETGENTGFWLEELAEPYYRFKDAGCEVTLASPKGGRPPMDPRSAGEEHRTETTGRFLADPEAQAALDRTVPLAEVDPAGFDAVFYPGGHGPLWDLADDHRSIRLIESFWAAEKPVAAVCHGPIALANARTRDGAPIVQGRRVAGFSNTEEAAVELSGVVPLSVEDVLRERGGQYAKEADFAPFAVSDGNLITGQNPASSARVAELLLEALR